MLPPSNSYFQLGFLSPPLPTGGVGHGAFDFWTARDAIVFLFRSGGKTDFVPAGAVKISVGGNALLGLLGGGPSFNLSVHHELSRDSTLGKSYLSLALILHFSDEPSLASQSGPPLIVVTASFFPHRTCRLISRKSAGLRPYLDRGVSIRFFV